MNKAEIRKASLSFEAWGVSSLRDSCFFLRTISNPVRLAILCSLDSLEGAQNTKLALSIGLDPVRESGNFNYHIHYLQRLGSDGNRKLNRMCNFINAVDPKSVCQGNCPLV